MNLPAPRWTEEQTPFIPYVPDDRMPANLKPVLDPYMKRMGFLPNALRLYAHRPEIAETLFRLNSNIMRDPSQTLPQLLKRKLSALASKTNGCAYCTAHCCNMLMRDKDGGPEGWGISQADLLQVLDDDYQSADAMERACFDFVLLQNLKAHLSPAQIVELACLVGFWKFYNAVHDSLHIPVEEHLLNDTRYVDV
jgi:alkylhydroperoxidase family enzyme